MHPSPVLFTSPLTANGTINYSTVAFETDLRPGYYDRPGARHHGSCGARRVHRPGGGAGGPGTGRGRGIGSALLGALLAGCERAGARQVIAVIADTGSDDASVALHRRFGFRQAGRLSGVGRKHGRWIDTMLMQRQLGSAQ